MPTNLNSAFIGSKFEKLLFENRILPYCNANNIFAWKITDTTSNNSLVKICFCDWFFARGNTKYLFVEFKYIESNILRKSNFKPNQIEFLSKSIKNNLNFYCLVYSKQNRKFYFLDKQIMTTLLQKRKSIILNECSNYIVTIKQFLNILSS